MIVPNDQFIIEPASNKPDLIPVCACWAFAEWACQVPGKTYEEIVASYTKRASSEELIPNMWIATTKSGKPAGVVSIKLDGHVERPDLNPWLGSLFVHPYYRGNRLGSHMEKVVLRQAREAGYNDVFLYSSIAAGYYRKNFWTEIGQVTEPGERPETKACLFKKEV